MSAAVAAERINPEDGDVFVLPAGASLEQAECLADAIQAAKPGVRAVVIVGEIEHLSESAMNRAGWYRK